MSEPVNPSTTARLDELAAVTREYAKYSRTSFGLAPAWLGGWLLVASALSAVWRGSGANLVRLTPVVWLWALAKARAHYQRHGEVIEEEEVPFPLPTSESGRRLFLGMIYFSCVFGIMEASRSGPGTLLFSAAIFVAVPAIATRVLKGITDAVVTAGWMWTVNGSLLRWLDAPPLPHAVLATFAAGLIAAGVWQHSKYLRLERRLAALRDRA